MFLTIFGTNIPDATGHQMKAQVPTSPNALPAENITNKILHFYSMQYDYFIKITHIKHILS